MSSKQTSSLCVERYFEGALQSLLSATTEDRAQYELRKITVALPRVREFSMMLRSVSHLPAVQMVMFPVQQIFKFKFQTLAKSIYN